MAGLPGSWAIVGVGPPLFCRGPSRGSELRGVVPEIVPLEDITRLGPLRVTVAELGWFPLTTVLTRSKPPLVLDRMLSVMMVVANRAEPSTMLLP